MLTLRTEMRVDGVTGTEIFEFLANPDDESYRAWWPGTHLQLHVRERGNEDHVGDVIYMDEYVGGRRLRMSAIVTEAVPGTKLVWRLKRGIRLPAFLCLELADCNGGVRITHTIRAGLRGVGGVFDPALKLLLSSSFAGEMDDHVRTEFPRLRDLLRERRRSAGGSPWAEQPPAG